MVYFCQSKKLIIDEGDWTDWDCHGVDLLVATGSGDSSGEGVGAGGMVTALTDGGEVSGSAGLLVAVVV